MGPLVSDGATAAQNAAGRAVSDAQREIRRAKRAGDAPRVAKARAAEKVARARFDEVMS